MKKVKNMQHFSGKLSIKVEKDLIKFNKEDCYNVILLQLLNCRILIGLYSDAKIFVDNNVVKRRISGRYFYYFMTFLLYSKFHLMLIQLNILPVLHSL